ncbi:MAG TPA: tyrosine-type recombinase/integrase [Clostridia bacterium]|nr:tyrosine-type recombinase/integrase [Clostridia bacterium]
MPNKRTRAITQQEYYLLVNTIRKGYTSAEGVKVKPNVKVSTILVLQANLGLRISDAISLKQTDIIKEGNRYRLSITEQKTGKKREFTVPPEIYTYIQGYMLERGIKPTQPLFDFGIRAVQKHLRITARHLGLDGIGTHSFRKFFCTEIYNNSSYNIDLCRILMQHSTSAVTQRYIGIQPQLIEQALANHIKLPS